MRTVSVQPPHATHRPQHKHMNAAFINPQVATKDRYIVAPEDSAAPSRQQTALCRHIQGHHRNIGRHTSAILIPIWCFAAETATSSLPFMASTNLGTGLLPLSLVPYPS